MPHATRAAERLAGATRLRERLSDKRWRHTLSVAETAYRLAEALGWTAADRDRLVQAALLHDLAKELSLPEQRALGGADGEEGFPGLVHARAGARLARAEFAIEDEEILQAIAFHPTATAGLAPLGQLLFVADYLEPSRRHLPAEDRALLERSLRGEVDLPALFCRVLALKLGWVLSEGLPLHPRSLAAWNAHCAHRG